MRNTIEISRILIPYLKQFEVSKKWNFTENELNNKTMKRNVLIVPPIQLENGKNTEVELYCYLNSNTTNSISDLFSIFDGFDVNKYYDKENIYYIFLDVNSITFKEMNTLNKASDSIHALNINISIKKR